MVYSIFNKPQRNLLDEEHDYTLNAPALYSEFSDDENNATAKYLSKVLLVEGIVSKVERNDESLTIFLEGSDFGGISCRMHNHKSPLLKSIKKGDEIRVKGLCSGMLLDVVLTKCRIIE